MRAESCSYIISRSLVFINIIHGLGVVSMDKTFEVTAYVQKSVFSLFTLKTYNIYRDYVKLGSCFERGIFEITSYVLM